MPDTVDNLILDLLEWIGPGRRPYRETMEAWRTSCPRLPVWEDATDLGFVERRHEPGSGAFVSVSAAGAEHLRRHRGAPTQCEGASAPSRLGSAHDDAGLHALAGRPTGGPETGRR